MVDMDMVDMDMVDMEMVDMDMVDQRNATSPTPGYGGQLGPRKQSMAMVHYWVRHAKCT